ncbi:T9SS type A sorting domain-containing protein [Flavobacterium sp.]|uniref:T9SS type A sorting domain-containing protein n=1 Tax=Flavobacterium sp. TaxID=239 RepID=UPI00375134D2
MKKLYFLFVALCLFTSVNAQIINFPDANFKAKLLASNPSNRIAQDLNYNFIKIDVNNNGEIELSEALQVLSLSISHSNISDMTGVESFTNLVNLSCGNNLLISLDVSNLSNLQSLNCPFNQLTSLNVSNLTNLVRLICFTNNLPQLNVSALINCTNLDCSKNLLTSLNLNGLVNLQSLVCRNNQIPSLDLTGLINMRVLDCGNNIISTLNVSNLINLQSLGCQYNQLTSLDVSNLFNLSDLVIEHNQISSLNLTGLTDLGTFYCSYNQLTSIDQNILNRVESFYCAYNQLSSLDMSHASYLIAFFCSGNPLTTLDLKNSTYLEELYCGNLPMLTSLLFKNGSNETSIDISNDPSLNYICADDSQLTQVQNLITENGYANCALNTYCSFTPGGTYSTIQGNNKYDESNNGCDVLDLGVPNLKFNITDGTNSGSIISNATGSYSIPVIAGIHTITPVLENPTYFAVFPTNVVVDFPTQTSPFTQNFCITLNGIHPDLEIAILPLQSARPGFDAKYKIIYKNKGNTTQSGTVNLDFNDAVLDLVLANPIASTQTVNNLSWAFTNLVPFETREIVVTLNVNSPLETPAVNAGDILNYTATITSPATDDLPNDNTFAYNQTVVNSYDPNDKTCLEGATITPTKVGDYLHYMIRFENNGTANAQNIVVKDMIDTAKFDINSIVPTKGSHSFVTNITAGNKVEFIFQNINLPFDDANNDGYVAFKIKTKSTLVLGDTFTNNASIYFDYNFPIVTNTATTTIAALSVQDFEFSNYFSVYPNPVSDVLTISAKESISVSSINIYNTLGQLVLVIPNAQNTKTVDVSSLTTGNYFIKINSDKGTSNTKFVKN